MVGSLIGLAGCVAAVWALYRFDRFQEPIIAVAGVVAALATAAAAALAARAARESSHAARDANRALALHYRPSITIAIREHRLTMQPPPNGGYFEQGQVGDTCVLRVSLTAPGGVRASRLDWIDREGNARTAALREGEQEVTLDGSPLLTTFVSVADPYGDTCAQSVGLRSLTFEADDLPTGTHWRAVVASGGPPARLTKAPVVTRLPLS